MAMKIDHKRTHSVKKICGLQWLFWVISESEFVGRMRRSELWSLEAFLEPLVSPD